MGTKRFSNNTRWIRQKAEELGFSVSHTNGGHIKFTHNSLAQPIYTSNTPRCQHAHMNAYKMMLRSLRDAGVTT